MSADPSDAPHSFSVAVGLGRLHSALAIMSPHISDYSDGGVAAALAVCVLLILSLLNLPGVLSKNPKYRGRWGRRKPGPPCSRYACFACFLLPFLMACMGILTEFLNCNLSAYAVIPLALAFLNVMFAAYFDSRSQNERS